MLHYLNNAGAGLMSAQTFGAIDAHLRREVDLGAYRAAQEARSLMGDFYTRAARIVNASDASELAFMDSASRAWNMALSGKELRGGDSILTLSSEFGTNLVSLFHRARQVGATVHVIACDEAGDFDLEEVAKKLNGGVSLIAVSHVAAHGSIVNPVQEIGRLARAHGTTFLVDGCQAVGQIPVDVQAIQCDAYTATGRKWLCGPRGTGFLYVNRSSSLRAAQVDLAAADLILDETRAVVGVDVRSDARQFELWERSIANMLGLSSAMEAYLQQDADAVWSCIRGNATVLRTAVCDNPRLCLLGKRESGSGVVGFYLRDPSQEAHVREKFDAAGLAISTMSDWDCPLHFPRNGAKSIFRLSAHVGVSKACLDVTCALLSEL